MQITKVETVSNKLTDKDLLLLNTKFKLNISEIALNKIKYLCKKISSTEWSGVTFYRFTGDVRDVANMVITIDDILPLNIGSGTYTEYSFNLKFVEYRMDHSDLSSHMIGHIHSHHTMGTFFSGTDLGELADSANSFNNFLSIIVNNAGVYSAALSYIGEVVADVNKKISFVDFIGNKFNKDIKEKQNFKKILYHFANIDKFEDEGNAELDTIISTLWEDKSKADKAKTFAYGGTGGYPQTYGDVWTGYKDYTHTPQQGNLFPPTTTVPSYIKTTVPEPDSSLIEFEDEVKSTIELYAQSLLIKLLTLSHMHSSLELDHVLKFHKTVFDDNYYMIIENMMETEFNIFDEDCGFTFFEVVCEMDKIIDDLPKATQNKKEMVTIKELFYNCYIESEPIEVTDVEVIEKTE